MSDDKLVQILPRGINAIFMAKLMNYPCFFSKLYAIRENAYTPLAVLKQDQEGANYRFRTEDGREWFFDRFGRLQRCVRG